MQTRVRSQEIFNRLCQVIPGGVNSPVRSCASMGQLPMIIDYGVHDTLVDVDGRRYIDFCCSWGALIHGHSHPDILKAVQARLAKGSTFGITTAIEEQLASEITSLIDSVDKIRFVSSGTEATMSAVRLARGFTKRDLIIKFSGNYHGHADFFLVQAGSGVFNLSPTSSSAGIPDEIVKYTICLPYNDIEACRQVFQHPDYRNKIAAVILEPVAGNMGLVPATREFIHFLREETQQTGTLLIFDEVITGFRVALKGAQDYYQVKPDLTCFGKIMGGGFPAAAFGGRQDIMDYLAPIGSVYQAGTLSGNPIAMEAGLQALRLLKNPNFYEELQQKTDLFLNPIQEAITKNELLACVQRVGSMFTIFFGKKEVRNMEEAKQIDAEMFARFFRYLFEKGVYIPPSAHEAWFISSVHKEENLIYTREAILEFLRSLN
jgi:glutamate-1-semialdehyde 2,1-aminomutase